MLKGPGWGQAGDTNTRLGLRDPRRPEHSTLTAPPVTTCSPGIPAASASRAARSRPTAPHFEGRDVSASSTGSPPSPARSSTRPAIPGWAWSAGRTAAASSSPRRPSTAASTRSSRSSRGTRWARASTRPTPPRPAGRPPLQPSSADHSTRTSPGAHTASDTTGVITPADASGSSTGARATRSPRSPRPTLFEQGTVDTLFTLDEAATNYGILQTRRRPHGDAVDVQRPRRVPHQPRQPDSSPAPRRSPG